MAAPPKTHRLHMQKNTRPDAISQSQSPQSAVNSYQNPSLKMKQKPRKKLIDNNLFLWSTSTKWVYSVWNACRVNNILFLIRFGGTRGQQIVTTYAIFCDHTFFQILGGGSVRRLQQNALLERAGLIQNSIFEKTHFFQQKSLKSIFHNSSARLAAKSWPSWRRHLTTVVSKKWFLFLVFCRPSAGIPLHSSVASLPYSPHVKDCTGLVP